MPISLAFLACSLGSLRLGASSSFSCRFISSNRPPAYRQRSHVVAIPNTSRCASSEVPLLPPGVSPPEKQPKISASQSSNAGSSAVCGPALSAQRVTRIVRFALSVALFAIIRANPVLAAPLAGLNTAWRGLDPAGFTAGLAASFVLVLVSEIGDKTFFISALLSMKYSRVLVLLGSMLALGSMTVISVVIGQVFHALPPSLNTTIPFDDYAAAALLLWFGYQSIRDGLSMREEEDDELRDAEEAVKEATSISENGPSPVRVVSETSSVVFLAEWGDKSMLATVALAAAKNPWGVIVGGVTGHLAASLIAVIGGSFLGKYISERSARLVGGVMFLIFAALTVLNLF